MAKDITIKPGETFTVTDLNRSFGTVTIEQGGNLKIETTAQVTIEHLIKK